jgi:adenosylcobyric acid synthase
VPSEDSVSIDDKGIGGGVLDLDIAVLRFPFISNFTDFEPLERMVKVRYVPMEGPLGSPDMVILPGTKNTVNDLKTLLASPLANEIKRLAGEGVPVLGICGGYQMLGEKVIDHGIEGGKEETIGGLSLLPAVTYFDKYEKVTCQTVKKVSGSGPILSRINGSTVRGYEIHMGKTNTAKSAFGDDGCVNDSGTVIGTYLHGIFSNFDFMRSMLEYLCMRKGIACEISAAEADPYEELADLVEANVEIDKIIAMAESH